MLIFLAILYKTKSDTTLFVLVFFQNIHTVFQLPSWPTRKVFALRTSRGKDIAFRNIYG